MKMAYYIEIGTETGNQQRTILHLKAGEDEARTPHKILENLLARAAEEVVRKQLPPPENPEKLKRWNLT